MFDKVLMSEVDRITDATIQSLIDLYVAEGHEVAEDLQEVMRASSKETLIKILEDKGYEVVES
jgi:hypothetical protein